ncbi:MAG: DNA primase, partial [Planctomycetes bacterium]|nr:DNA primase [Planctomycetota bacterium]
MAGHFDSTLVTRIQQSNDIVDIVSEHLNLINKGKDMVGLCPFHDDHSPSMYVSPSKQIFKCFACGAGGDVIKFIQMRENLTFVQALQRLAQRAGIKFELTHQTRSRQKSSEGDPDPGDIAKVNTWAMKLWQKNLSDENIGRVGREYIAGRGITEKISAEFSLGLALESWDALLAASKNSGISEKLLLDAGLVVRRNEGGCYDKFRNRLMFPIFDVSGRVIGFGGRTLGDDPAKYMNSPTTVLFDKSNSSYGLDKARHKIVSSGIAVVVEGYTDVIMAHQFGCNNVVATLGTSFTAGHAQLLKRYAKTIVLVFDSDIAGVEAAARATEVCLLKRIDIKIASVPQGKDPCDFLLAAGAQAFESLISEAADVMQFQWDRLAEKFSKTDNMTDRRNATENFLQTIATTFRTGSIDAITRGLIVNRLSKVTGMTSGQINAELGKRLRRTVAGTVNVVPNQKVASIDMAQGLGQRAQAEIIEVLLNEPRLFESARRKITADS